MKRHFIGFYNYTIILTLLSLISTVIGMTQAIHGHYKTAIFCLAFSGLCDGFDGRVARTKKDRTEDEKSFGIQLDSLCDVICFGVFPALICYLLGVRGVIGMIMICFYCVCAIMRLGYYNVLEVRKMNGEDLGSNDFHGLPVTSIAVILPLLFWAQLLVSDFAFLVILHVMLGVVGFLFILDFPVKKLSLRGLLILIAVVAISVGLIFGVTRFKIPRVNDDSSPIINEIVNTEEESTAQ